MTKRGKFHVPIYGCDVIIIVSDRIKESLNQYLAKNDNEKLTYSFEGLVWRPDDRVGKYYVFFDKDTLSINTYNHEKSHLVEWILKDRSITAQNEIRAYLDAFISDKMNKFFAHRRMKLK